MAIVLTGLMKWLLTIHFYILQNKVRYDYRVETVDRALRTESKPYFPNMAKRVTLVSCEKYLAPGYTQKRGILNIS